MNMEAEDKRYQGQIAYEKTKERLLVDAVSMQE